MKKIKKYIMLLSIISFTIGMLMISYQLYPVHSNNTKIHINNAKQQTNQKNWTEREIEKLQYGSYLSPKLKDSISSNLRFSDEKINHYILWFDRQKGWNKGYYLWIDPQGKVIRLETKIESND